MSFLQRSIPVLTCIVIGVGTGYYVFDPLLKQYEKDTHGTWKKPGDDERIEKVKKEYPIIEKLEGSQPKSDKSA
ncbi:hypothetical protein VKS41_002585 [Umbelopsis sp. WA50703]